MDDNKMKLLVKLQEFKKIGYFLDKEVELNSSIEEIECQYNIIETKIKKNKEEQITDLLNAMIESSKHFDRFDGNSKCYLIIIYLLSAIYVKSYINEHDLFKQTPLKIKQTNENCMICSDTNFNEYVECSHNHLLCYDCYQLINKNKCCVCSEKYVDSMVFKKN